MSTNKWPVTLTIAGSDSGGGAGIQADLKTFQALGCFGTSAIVAVTAQNTCGVHRIDALPVEAVRAQIDAILCDFDVAAVKIGMLATRDLVLTVADALTSYGRQRPPVVLDPVMVASTGARLLDENAISAMRSVLLPLATVCTPNLPEAELLQAQADGLSELARQSGCAILVTGGDADSPTVRDQLWRADGTERTWQAARVPLTDPSDGFHGTGCTLSSAIAAHLAHGLALEDAIEAAILYVQRLVARATKPGAGHRVLLHGSLLIPE